MKEWNQTIINEILKYLASAATAIALSESVGQKLYTTIEDFEGELSSLLCE